MLMTLEQIKRHLNIDDEFTEDDEYIMSLYEVAVDLVQRHIDMTFDELTAKDGEVPKPLLHAVLLMIGNFYANRESVTYASVSEVPMSAQYILRMYRDYTNHIF